MSGQQLRIHLATLSSDEFLVWVAVIMDNSVGPPLLTGKIQMTVYSEETLWETVLRLVARMYSPNEARYARRVSGACVPGEAHARMTELLNQGFPRTGKKRSLTRLRQIAGKKRSAPGRSRIIRLLKLLGDKCHWCSKTVSLEVAEKHPDRATVEHLLQVSKGGSDRTENLRVACFRCNNRRSSRDGAMPPEGW